LCNPAPLRELSASSQRQAEASVSAPAEQRHGIEAEFLHTSGHASWDDLKRLVEGIRPGVIAPVHTEHASRYAQEFPNVRLLDDGQPMGV